MPSQKRFKTELDKIQFEIIEIKKNLNNIVLLINEYNDNIKRITNPLIKRELDLKDYMIIDDDLI